MIPERTGDVDRRTVLRASGIALTGSVVGLAGCADPQEDEPADPGTPGGEGEPADDPETPGDDTPTPTPSPTPEGGG